MTQKEIKLINAINVDGISNEMWGIVSTPVTGRDFFGFEAEPAASAVIPPHIYVYRECEEQQVRNDITPDLTTKDKFGQVIDLYYITEE